MAYLGTDVERMEKGESTPLESGGAAGVEPESPKTLTAAPSHPSEASKTAIPGERPISIQLRVAS
jgi:hypothetical protein